jgi:6-phosphogluconate dehydrogenase (decarboxylating)
MTSLRTVGLIGLDKTGFGLALKLLKNKLTVVAYDPVHINRQTAVNAGIVVTSSMQAVILHLPTPKVLIGYMATIKAAEAMFSNLPDLLSAGDMVIDNGKMPYRLLIELQQKGVSVLQNFHTKGQAKPTWDFDREKTAFEYCRPIFDAF